MGHGGAPDAAGFRLWQLDPIRYGTFPGTGQGEAAASLAEGTVTANPDGSTLADLTVD